MPDVAGNTKNYYSAAFSVDDASTMLVVLFLGNPGGSEGGEGSESRGTLPYGVLSVGGSDDSDLGTGGGKGGELGL